MTTLRFLDRRAISGALIGASVLLLASFEPAAAQFPPPPGQPAASPSTRSRRRQASNNSNRIIQPFPAPGQGSARRQAALAAPPAEASAAPREAVWAVPRVAASAASGQAASTSRHPAWPPRRRSAVRAQRICLTFPPFAKTSRRRGRHPGRRRAQGRAARRSARCSSLLPSRGEAGQLLVTNRSFAVCRPIS